MNDEWNDWLKELEATAEEVGQRMQETVDAVVETTDWMLQVPLAIAEQVEEAVAAEMDQLINEFVDWLQPPINLSIEFDSARLEMEWHSGFAEPWVERVEPTAHQNAACIGCKHYHGRVYNGSLLVCGMHPYGWEDAQCPDWDRAK
ncbi:MAG: hypothetical protein VKL39_02540 [Leptolyngbyaceae bacterium]|nr:hypothetical protein [Leptolyngbyaceae bacterium]